MAGPHTLRAQAREQTMQRILQTSREHLAEHGAAGLSLRAVARDVGLVSSAVYRYVKNRDDLLTLLIVEGYNDLGDAVDAAVTGAPDDHRGRFRALGRAVRVWATENRATYGLLYGSPVPGYAAPESETTQPGTRVAEALLRIIADADADGVVEKMPAIELTGGLAAGFDEVRRQFVGGLPDEVISRGVFTWSALFGAVSFEVFGQYGPDGMGDPAALFDLHLDLLADLLGLP